MAESTDPVQAPSDREKALSAAYLRMTGSTQADAASAAGIGTRTLERWESCSWWSEVKFEAAGRWLAGLRGKTMKSLGTLVEEMEPATVRFVAERIIEELAPPKQRAELSGPGGTPVEIAVTRTVVAAKNRLAGYTGASANGSNGNGKP